MREQSLKCVVRLLVTVCLSHPSFVKFLHLNYTPVFNRFLKLFAPRGSDGGRLAFASWLPCCGGLMVCDLLFGVQNRGIHPAHPRQTKHLRTPRDVLLVSIKHGPAAVEVNFIGTPLNPH